MLRALRPLPGLLLAVMLAACGADPAPVIPIEAEAGWPQWPRDRSHGQVTAVDVDAQNRVFVLHRAGREWPGGEFPTDPIAQPVVDVFDGGTGALIGSWGAGVFVMPHGLSIDAHGNVWITDAAREQVLQFTPEGTELGTMGEDGVTGADGKHFGRPTDVAFDAGNVLVADGYLNTRIATFDAAGRLRSQFDGAGGAPGQFKVPHSIDAHANLLIVTDRENGWVRIFDRHGVQQGGWSPDAAGIPYAAKILPEKGVLVAEGRDRRGQGTAILRLYRMDGTLLRSFDLAAGGGGNDPGQHKPHRAHDLAIGPDGAIYVADVMAGEILKLAPGSLETD